MQAIPRSLVELEDALPGIMARAPGSARTKLTRIYKVMDQLSSVRAPFVACGKGCADCCRMNMSMSSLEARTVSQATGRAFVEQSESVLHPDGKFVGVSCPFLVDNACSIYEIRPLACRRHASFHTSAAWCTPEEMLVQKVPLVRFGGIDEAFSITSANRRTFVVADVRDCFPD